jgi:nucleoside-diphosphate-sugar epimerase
MKILVTGGSGYLGTHVRTVLQADDFSRRSGLDILDPTNVVIVSDYDAVIHLAAFSSKDPADAAESFRTNVKGTINLLQQMQPGKIFIFASTKDVYGTHADAYQEVPESCSTSFQAHTALEWSKLIAEKYIQFYAARNGFRSCIFRLSTVYARPSEGNANGFVTHYVESVKRGWPIRLPLDGLPVRDILHVEDFARACQAFIDSPVSHGLYNLGGGTANALSLREIVDRVADVIQCSPVIDETAELPAPVPLNYVSDLTLVRAELNWQPEISTTDGLRSLI